MKSRSGAAYFNKYIFWTKNKDLWNKKNTKFISEFTIFPSCVQKLQIIIQTLLFLTNKK